MLPGSCTVSAVTLNLTFKYNDLDILFLKYTLRCILYSENKLSAQVLNLITLLLSSNTKGVVLLNRHTPITMFEFFRRSNFVFLQLLCPEQLRFLTSNFHAMQLVTIIHSFELHQQNLLGYSYPLISISKNCITQAQPLQQPKLYLVLMGPYLKISRIFQSVFQTLFQWHISRNVN